MYACLLCVNAALCEHTGKDRKHNAHNEIYSRNYIKALFQTLLESLERMLRDL